MRRLAATLVAIVPIFAFTHVASAADLPRKAPAYAPPPPPALSWTGWYVGLNAGGNWGTSDPATNAIPVDPSTSFFDGCINAASGCIIDQSMVSSAGSQSVRTSGFTGGIHGGYNYQMNKLLLGVEGGFEKFRRARGEDVTVGMPNRPPPG